MPDVGTREILAEQFAPNCSAAGSAVAASRAACGSVDERARAGGIVRAVEEGNWPLFVGWEE